jgi:hypothetical protein
MLISRFFYLRDVLFIRERKFFLSQKKEPKMKNLDGEIKHYIEFEKKSRIFGIEKIIHMIPFNREEIEAALKLDVTLNSIHIDKWYVLAGISCATNNSRSATYQGLMAPKGHPFYQSKLFNSMCDRVCVLKHVARYYITNHPIPTASKKPRNKDFVDQLRHVLFNVSNAKTEARDLRTEAETQWEKAISEKIEKTLTDFEQTLIVAVKASHREVVSNG